MSADGYTEIGGLLLHFESLKAGDDSAWINSARLAVPVLIDEVVKLRTQMAELEAENLALIAMLPGSSHGFIRLRAHVDPAVSREEAREMKGERKEPL